MFVYKIITMNKQNKQFIKEIIRKNNFNKLNKLLNNGVDINVQNKDGNTPLIISLIYYYYHSYLNTPLRNIGHCILSAFTSKYYYLEDISQNDIIDYLVNNGANVNIKNNKNKTALMYASTYDNFNIVNYLLKHGADPNIKDNYGYTALTYASIYSDKTICKCLIDNGADINTIDKWGCSILANIFICSNEYNIHNIIFLIKNGININTKDNRGQTPLIHIVLNNINIFNIRKLIITFLIENGADINIKDNYGNTALIYAVHLLYEKYLICSRFSNYDIIEELLVNGADINIKNNYGKTVIDYAKKNETIKLINKYKLN